MTFDSDNANTVTRRMWLKIGRMLHKAAIGWAEKGSADYAIKTGMAAEACYWQATGEADAFGIQDIVRGEKR